MMEGNITTAFATSLSEFLQYGNTQDLWKPAVDMFEGPQSIKLHVYIPGVDMEGISVDFINNYVTLKGTRKFPEIDHMIIRRSQEIIYGSFERRIKLSIHVTDRASVSISMEQGVMIITINKDLETQNSFRMGIADINR